MKKLLLFTMLVLFAVLFFGQPCGEEWKAPFICSIQARVSVNGGDPLPLVSGKPLKVPMQSTLSVEFRAEDQNGWSFPEEKWVILCEEKPDDEPLLSFPRHKGDKWIIQVASEMGKTALFCFVPGNLNITFVLPIEVGRVEELTRNQAEFLVTCLYRAILGREPDPSGLSVATMEVLRGKIKKIVDGMFYSEEFKRKRKKLTPYELLEDFYQGLLGRPVDSEGVKAFLHRLEKKHYSETIMRILASEEFQKRLMAHR